MKILHLETSSKNCSVAVSSGKELICSCEQVSQDYKQSESLHSFVQWALEGAEITLQELDAVCLGKGPGSYTGLRIGAASAKGFCFGLGIPLLAVDSLDSLAIPFFGENYDCIIAMVDARRMEVYAKVFDAKGQELEPTSAVILQEDSWQQYRDKKIAIVGDGARKAKEILQLSDAHYFPDAYPSAKEMISQANKRYQEKKWEDIAYFEPFYLKEFQGVKQKK